MDNAVVFSGVNGDCIDRDSRCGSWAAKGECASNPSYMTKNCIKSCNKCDDGKSSLLDNLILVIVHKLWYVPMSSCELKSTNRQ